MTAFKTKHLKMQSWKEPEFRETEIPTKPDHLLVV